MSWRRRHGRGLSRARPAAAARGRDQGFARRVPERSRSPAPIRAGSPRRGAASTIRTSSPSTTSACTTASPSSSRSCWKARRCASGSTARPLPPRNAVGYAIADRQRPGRRRTNAASSTATSSPRTCSSPATAGSRFSTSAWRRCTGPDAIGDATETVTIDGVPPRPSWAQPATCRRNRRAACARTIARTSSASGRSSTRCSPVLRRSAAARAAETLSAICTMTPPTNVDRRSRRRALQRIVRHCLEKEPEARFQNARDLDLRSRKPARAMAVTTPAIGRRRLCRSAPRSPRSVLLAVSAVALLGFFAGKRGAPATVPAPYRRPPGDGLPGVEEFPSISPDRRSVAFTANVNGRRQIFVRLLGERMHRCRSRKTISITSFRGGRRMAMRYVYFSPAGPGEVQGRSGASRRLVGLRVESSPRSAAPMSAGRPGGMLQTRQRPRFSW